ncbi:f8e80cfa-c1ed-4ff8-af73-4d2196086ba6 [Sclerotinia trifoliorum]|uniref:F8e80cfa-c1ed-4ff8-af73-4d2196086ba6 n=1 Tax=Sclerotinia trifoliorum TaxID=28548 RepID=A0A8H2ZQB1_9HELO|nr:f8e80cfa-c1ed-4ff8-af73-4d2196086ba6 [Sclerotinia trifoliorum]
MRLLLIRHGETVDNVANVYAGITDSALTNHGVLQANRLGTHLAASKISKIFSSDLQRAVKTAEAIRAAQDNGTSLEVTKLELLREQDFGHYEKKPFHERSKDSNKTGKEIHSEAHRSDPGFKDVESKESMKRRMETFVKEHLMHLLEINDNNLNGDTIIVVAHGTILGHLWRVILRQFNPKNVSIGPDVPNPERGLEYIGGWSNTGYLELVIKSIPNVSPAKVGLVPPVSDEQSNDQTSVKLSNHNVDNVEVIMSLMVNSVNNQDHLKGLKKTRGGLGSLKHDPSQRTMDLFFKKRRLG